MTHRRFVIATIVLAVATVAASWALAADRSPGPVERKVRVMERVVDAVLVESPNVVVAPMSTTRGLVLDGYGALFTFNAELNVDSGLVGFRSGTVLFGADAQELLHQQRAEAGELDDEGNHFLSAEKLEAEREKLLEAFRREMVDTLIDYGATLAELGDDQKVTIAAFLGGGGLGLFVVGSDEHRLVAEARMADLREHAAGRLDRQEMAKRIRVEVR